MTFLSPIWFFALAALSIPVLIHLWNIRPGKTLKVGSISLITEASKNTSRSFKLLDLLLLLLRCLLLTLIALFLAAPVWQKNIGNYKAKGWVLVPKENLKETYQKFKPQIDSLTKAGIELHYFNKDFGKIDPAKLAADTSAKDIASIANYWSLIRQLDTKVSASLPIHLFTPNGLHHFTGDKPSVNLNLKWRTYIPADSASKWIAGAWFTDSNAIKVTVGKSSPSGIYFSDKYIQNDGDAEIAVNVQNGQPIVSLKNTTAVPVIVDTVTMRIAIYANKYSVDAHYLNAALKAVVKFGGRKVIINQYNNTAKIPGGQSWLFWLANEQINGSLLTNTKNIFRYDPGKVASVSTWITASDKYALSNGDQKIMLYKVVETNSRAEPIWQDGFGRAVLDSEKQRVNIYRFYSHFNPAWNDLVWSDDFPKMILKLINDNRQTVPDKYDKRILSDQQMRPNIIKETKEVATTKPVEQTDISKYFWLLLILVFIAERWLSHQIKDQVNG